MGADRRAAQAPLRPDPQPGRDGEGLRRPREGDARGVIQARNTAMTASTVRPTRPQAENMLTGALSKLFALSEAYPDLKANQNFLHSAGGADRHRGPGRLRAAVLQRHRAEVQHQDPDVPDGHLRRDAAASPSASTSRPKTPHESPEGRVLSPCPTVAALTALPRVPKPVLCTSRSPRTSAAPRC